jgi:4'-phosphopantetheinyl transferase
VTVFWLIDEQIRTDTGKSPVLGEPPAFLHPAERPALAKMRAPKRQAEWLHGRFAAKTLLLACHPDCQDRSLVEILIAHSAGGAPYAVLVDDPNGSGPRLAGCLSISHSGLLAAAALALETGLQVGIDIEKVEPRPLGFFESYFTSAEADAIRGCAPALQAGAITLVWSAKESALKALGKGLSLDTRRIEIRPDGFSETEAAGATRDPSAQAWRRFEVGGGAAAGLNWQGWWQPYRDYLLTLAVACPGSGQRLGNNVLLQVG